ncbi:hypothetical protein D3C85_1741370 [compost metagenome]
MANISTITMITVPTPSSAGDISLAYTTKVIIDRRISPNFSVKIQINLTRR